VAHDEGRGVEFLEDGEEQRGVFSCPDRSVGRRRRPESREIHRQGTKTRQTVGEVTAASAPAVKGEDARLANTDRFGKQGPIHQRPQSQFNPR
jgi:hypothetical protein